MMTPAQICQFDKLFTIFRDLLKMKFSGKIVVNFHLGGITRIEEQKSYEI